MQIHVGRMSLSSQGKKQGGKEAGGADSGRCTGGQGRLRHWDSRGSFGEEKDSHCSEVT